MHCFDKINLDLIFNGIAAFGTLGAFIFAIIIAKNISFKKDLRKKQLDTIFELVGHLQDLQIYFSYNTPNSTGDIYFPFFNMTKEKFRDTEDLVNSNATIFVSENFLYDNPIFKFVKNPFLPESVALKLINLYPRGGNQFKYNLGQNQVYISDDRNYTEHTYREEISQYYLTLNKLFETTEELSLSIKAWLKKNGADDLNFKEKLINIQNYP